MTIRAFNNKLNPVEFRAHEVERVASETGILISELGIMFIKRFFTELLGSQVARYFEMRIR